jgi:hypothetical protein
MKKIFLAFPDYKNPKEIIKKYANFELWNLKKIKPKEFVSLIQEKIKPFNKNVKNNYFHVSSEIDFEESYKNSSWGILLPDYALDYMDGQYESSLAINLFSQYSMPVMFTVQKMGISVIKRRLNPYESFTFREEYKKFKNEKFIKFYDKIFSSPIGARWQAYEVAKWKREDWRLNICCLLFKKLEKYEKSTEVMTWQEECADIATFYESLLSRTPGDNGKYKISQRIEILLGNYYKKSFGKIKNDINDLYESRNEFVHGTFFDRLHKSTENYPDNQKMAQLPSFDYKFLERQAILAKQVFIVFLYLRIKFTKKLAKLTIPEIISLGIMDIKIRNKIQLYAKEVLDLVSFSYEK